MSAAPPVDVVASPAAETPAVPETPTPAAGGAERWRPVPQSVDPRVSRAKFAEQVARFRAHESDYRRRGWMLVEAEFPNAVVLFAAAHVRPAVLLYGVRFEFTNFDLLPPSVQFIDPFTREPLTHADLKGTPVLRRVAVQPPVDPGVPSPGPLADATHPEASAAGDAGAAAASPPAAAFELVELLQSWTPDELPFLCLRGVREYHLHPGHTGDPWLLYRDRGEGTLVGLCETIDAHGVQPITGFHVQFQLRSGRAGRALQQEIEARVSGVEIDADRVPV